MIACRKCKAVIDYDCLCVPAGDLRDAVEITPEDWAAWKAGTEPAALSAPPTTPTSAPVEDVGGLVTRPQVKKAEVLSDGRQVFDVVMPVRYMAVMNEAGGLAAVYRGHRMLYGDDCNRRGRYLGRSVPAECKRVRDAILAALSPSLIQPQRDADPGEYPPPCTDPGGHSWVCRDDNEEISYCEHCGADGNA